MQIVLYINLEGIEIWIEEDINDIAFTLRKKALNKICYNDVFHKFL